MHCPYCNSELVSNTIKDSTGKEAVVQECFNCGGHWFPYWLANDISLTQAQNTDSVLPKTEIKDTPSLARCPMCNERLTLISHDSIPKGLHIWACPQAHGNFFPKGELIQFKKAQQAKITYHELWGIPLKSVFTVLVPIFLVLTLAAGVPLTVELLQSPQETRTKASNILSTPTITSIPPDSYAISFTTPQESTTTIDLYQNDQKLKTEVINTSPTKTHVIVLKNLDPNFVYTYRINVTTNNEAKTSDVYELK